MVVHSQQGSKLTESRAVKPCSDF